MDFLQAASTPIDYLFEADQTGGSSGYPGLDKYATGGVGEQTESEFGAACWPWIHPLSSILHCSCSGGGSYTGIPWGRSASLILLTYLQAEASSPTPSILRLRYASSRRGRRRRDAHREQCSTRTDPTRDESRGLLRHRDPQRRYVFHFHYEQLVRQYGREQLIEREHARWMPEWAKLGAKVGHLRGGAGIHCQAPSCTCRAGKDGASGEG